MTQQSSNERDGSAIVLNGVKRSNSRALLASTLLQPKKWNKETERVVSTENTGVPVRVLATVRVLSAP
jgi:hypothetical protein